MEAVERHPRLRLQLVATGMHLLKKFGHTIDDIVRDGWRIDARVRMQAGDDSPTDQAVGLSRGVAGIARFCDQAKTDIVVVLGDRIEAMAGALAGVTTGRLVAHIHGGDVAPGDFDDSVRHAITKLAHLHLVATQSARRRIIRMGESADRVHCVGAPGLDRLFELTRRARKLRSRSNKALIVQHACGRSPSRERQTMNWILQAVQRAGLAPTIVYPNTDRGHAGIIQAIEAYRGKADNGFVQVVRSLARDRYLQLLIEADVLVGNSSSGLIEAATAGTAAVNIGPRQNGRQASGRSVVHSDESPSSIHEALRQALGKRPVIGRPSVYGNGCAGHTTADVLAGTNLKDDFRRKVITY
jgi:UDP-N-acetylglucosamine 2-epimerase (non-hydrolysing)/GDP/UDP-N,N'-diacetylbacillosamine 2-epimerase (hydrolysing)